MFFFFFFDENFLDYETAETEYKGSDKANVFGRAFEFACSLSIAEYVKNKGIPYDIQYDETFKNAEKAFGLLTAEQQERYVASSNAAVKLLVPVEPMLNSLGTLKIKINPDSAAQGVENDVRDVVIEKNLGIKHWEIGLSCKHNHDAMKHQRITVDFDFARQCIGYSCSEYFISRMTELFRPVEEYTRDGVLWCDILEFKYELYHSILEYYIEEIKYLCSKYDDVPSRFVSYFLGTKDFYKIIMDESKSYNTIEGYNINGTLNKSNHKLKPIFRVPKIRLPKRLLFTEIKPPDEENLYNTLVMYFDEGWTVSMRLHNKDKRVKRTAFAWDVALKGYPKDLFRNLYPWCGIE